MFVFGNVILGIAKVLDVLLNIYMWVIIIRALISWVKPDPYNPIVQFLQRENAAGATAHTARVPGSQMCLWI